MQVNQNKTKKEHMHLRQNVRIYYSTVLGIMNKTYTGLLYGKQDHPQGPKKYFKIEANSKRKFKL